MKRFTESEAVKERIKIQNLNSQKGMYAGYIAALRKDAKITMMKMSQIAGCSPAEYSSYEHERKEFDPEIYRKCEKYLKEKEAVSYTHLDVYKRQAELVSAHFGIEFSEKQCKAYKKNHDIISGVDCRFEKGHVPANKGKPMSQEQYEKCRATMFKKGDVPANHMEVGEYTHTTDGYLIRKVKETRCV